MLFPPLSCSHLLVTPHQNPSILLSGNARGSLSRLPQAARSFRSPHATRSLSAHGSPSASRPTTVGTVTSTANPAQDHTAGNRAPPAEQKQGESSYQHNTAPGLRRNSRPHVGTQEGREDHAHSHFATHPAAHASAGATRCSTSMSMRRPASQHQHGIRPSSVSSLGGYLQNTLPPPAMRGACKAWEQEVPHPTDFTSATRRTRVYDVPAASKVCAVHLGILCVRCPAVRAFARM